MFSRGSVAILAAVLLAACGGTAPESGPVESAPPRASQVPAPAPVIEEPAAQEQQERIVMAQAEPASDSGRFVLGQHYRRLSPTQPTSSSPDQVEVAEIFWYGCPHCYTFDPYLESWREDLPPHVSFVRIPAVWNPLLQLHARAFYTAEALGVTEQMHTPMFREIHVNGNGLNTEEALQEFFGRFDVDAETFQGAFNSFAVHTKLQRADDLSRRYRISSVPTVIVNGKYSTDATAAGSYNTLLEVIDELVDTEAAGN
jgi:thiol:disulfide interchange protein DsbA